MSCITFIILPVPQTVLPLPPLGLAALCFWPCQIFGQSPSCAPFFLFSMSISPIFSYPFRQHLLIQLSQWKDESRASPCTGFWVYEVVGRHGGPLTKKEQRVGGMNYFGRFKEKDSASIKQFLGISL